MKKSIKFVHLEDEWNRHAQIIEDLHYIRIPEEASHVRCRGNKSQSITSRGKGAGLKMLLYFYDIDACHAEIGEKWLA
jgi:hypothetical protein